MTGHNSEVDHRLDLLRRYWQRHPSWQRTREPRPTARQHLTVAISREAGSPGLEVARHIGQRSNWPVYDREILNLIAQESGLRGELLESVDEHDRNWLVEAITSFKRRGEVNSATFVHHLVHVMSALAAHGKCIVVGRGAAAYLPRATTLRVRVMADLGDRVHRVAAEQRLSEDKALEEVERVDHERSQFVARHFHRDVNDVHNFDLVLNASRLAPATCAILAVEALRSIENRPVEIAGSETETSSMMD